MPTINEVLAQMQGSKSLTISDALAGLMQTRPTLFERGTTQAKSRVAALSEFAESPWMLLANPGLYAGKKIRDLVGLNEPLEAKREEWKREAASLPEARGGWEKTADIVGSALPDVALGIATAPVAGLGAAGAAARGAGPFLSTLAGQGLQSAALAPIEFGTRDPKSAALNTLIAPVAGTLLNRGVARLLGRGAKEVPTSPDTDLLALQKLKLEQLREGTPYPTTPIKGIGEFEPRAPVAQEPFTPVRQASWERLPTEGEPKLVTEALSTDFPADAVHRLFGRGNLPNASVSEILKARSFLQKRSREALSQLGSQRTITAYRGLTGSEGSASTISLSLDESAARELSPSGTVEAREIPIDKVLYYGGAFRGRDFFAPEGEIIVPSTVAGKFTKLDPIKGASASTLSMDPNRAALLTQAQEELVRETGRFPAGDEILSRVEDIKARATDLRPAIAAQLPEEKLFVSPEELFQGTTRVDQELMLKAPPDLGLEQQMELPLSFQTAPPVPKKLRTYYLTPDGRVHTNAVPGATKIRAASRAAARATLENPPPEQFSRLEGIKAAQRLKDALIAGDYNAHRAISTEALMELGDETVAKVGRESFEHMLQEAHKALRPLEGTPAYGQLMQDIAETAERLPPKTNVEIADALDTLSPEQKLIVLQKLKGKGTCPL